MNEHLSPLEKARPKNLKGHEEGRMALADKVGGGGIKGWIERAREDARRRQKLQKAQRTGYTSEKPSRAEALPELKYTTHMDSDNLAQEVHEGRVKVLENGLLDMVALLGSTHFRANWREEKVMPDLEAHGIPHYTPRMENWNYELHPNAESLALSQAAVLAVNIENRHFRDGSLGSMVEIGMAALSAALNGQKVVLCFEKDLQKSLTEPGAVAQYRALQENLRHARKLFPHLITVVADGDLDAFEAQIENGLHQQRKPETSGRQLSREKFAQHEKLKAERMADPLAYDVFGGSSGTFSKNPELVSSFEREQTALQAEFPAIRALNKWPFADVWDYASQQLPEHKAGAYYLAFKSEQPIKADARVLVWSIQDEAVSKAAITELGFLLLNALESGQQVMVVMEPFNAEQYVSTVFREKTARLRAEVELIQQMYLNQNLPFNAGETQKVREFLQKLEDPNDQTSGADLLKEIKASPILSKTQMFWEVDNARRTRSIIDAQMKRLLLVLQQRKDEIGEPFFTFATSTEEFKHQAEALKAKYNMQFSGPVFDSLSSLGR